MPTYYTEETQKQAFKLLEERGNEEIKEEDSSELKGIKKDSLSEGEVGETSFPEMFKYPLVKKIISKMDTGEEALREYPDNLAFDLSEGMHIYKIDYNDNNPIINEISKILHEMKFKPSPMMSGDYKELEELGQEVYTALQEIEGMKESNKNLKENDEESAGSVIQDTKKKILEAYKKYNTEDEMWDSLSDIDADTLGQAYVELKRAGELKESKEDEAIVSESMSIVNLRRETKTQDKIAKLQDAVKAGKTEMAISYFKSIRNDLMILGLLDDKNDKLKESEDVMDEDSQFSEWFNEEMKKHGFNEGLFDSIKSFVGAVQTGVGKAKDVAGGAKAGLKAIESGKGAGDVLSIAGTTMKVEKFKRAYKEMWLGFNKGLKMLNPKLQEKVSNDDKVRDSVNQILGNVIDGLEQGKIRKLAAASQKALPGTNPEQAEAKAQAKKGDEGSEVTA